MRLTITERAALKRLHGLTVCIETGGVAVCRDAAGERKEYAIDHLRHVLREVA
jgi:hypothetical protein